MKKLNLKDIKNGMSRNEMRSIKGAAGCGGCNLGNVCTSDDQCGPNISCGCKFAMYGYGRCTAHG